MIPQFNDLCDLLDEIPAMEIIRTSYNATAKDYPLPAIIVDFQPGRIGAVTENDEKLYIKAQFALTCCAEMNAGDPDESLNAALAVVEAAMSKLVNRYKSIDFDALFPHAIPFGATEAFAIGFAVTLPDEEFELEIE